MDRQLISVCMPTYNGASYISEAIESVIAQSHTNFELIITDDSSQDQTVEIIESYCRRDPRIRLIQNEARLGPIKNHNFSVTSSNGQFIKLLAQDDVLNPTCLEECLNEMERDTSLTFVTFAKDWIDSSGNLITNEHEVKKEYVQFFQSNTRLTYEQTLVSVLSTMTNWVGAPSTLMLRREFFAEGYNPKFNHLMDIEFYLRLLRRGDGLYIAHRLGKFRKHSANQSAVNAVSPQAFFEWIKMGLQHGDKLSASTYSFSSFCLDFYHQLATHLSISPALRQSFSDYCSEAHTDLDESNVGALLMASGVLSLSRVMQQASILANGAVAAETWREQREQYKSEIESLRQALEMRRAFDQLDDLHHTKSRIQKELASETAARVQATIEAEALRKRVSEVESELNAERNVQSGLRSKLKEMGGSKSWKLTAPLRIVNHWISASGAPPPSPGVIRGEKFEQ